MIGFSDSFLTKEVRAFKGGELKRAREEAECEAIKRDSDSSTVSGDVTGLGVIGD